MAIQPIDLQNMYSQIQNVAKTQGNFQATQLAGSIQQVTASEKNLENSKKVQNTNNDNSKSATINQNGSGGSSKYFGEQKKEQNQNQNEDDDYILKNVSLDPHLGSIIDITR